MAKQENRRRPEWTGEDPVVHEPMWSAHRTLKRRDLLKGAGITAGVAASVLISREIFGVDSQHTQKFPTTPGNNSGRETTNSKETESGNHLQELSKYAAEYVNQDHDPVFWGSLQNAILNTPEALRDHVWDITGPNGGFHLAVYWPAKIPTDGNFLPTVYYESTKGLSSSDPAEFRRLTVNLNASHKINVDLQIPGSFKETLNTEEQVRSAVNLFPEATIFSDAEKKYEKFSPGIWIATANITHGLTTREVSVNGYGEARVSEKSWKRLSTVTPEPTSAPTPTKTPQIW